MQVWQFDSGEIGKRSFQFVGQGDTELNECLKFSLFFSGFCVKSVLKVYYFGRGRGRGGRVWMREEKKGRNGWP